MRENKTIEKKQNDPDVDYDPYNDGWNKRISHHQKGDNPFGLNNWKYYEWEKGWLEADEAIQK